MNGSGNRPHQAQRVATLRRFRPTVSLVVCEQESCLPEQPRTDFAWLMLCMLRLFFKFQTPGDQECNQHKCSNSATHNSIMGHLTICSTANSILQRPVRLHAASAKLACCRSAFTGSNSQLHLARPAARATSCRTKTVMGLPIPIIGRRTVP